MRPARALALLLALAAVLRAAEAPAWPGGTAGDPAGGVRVEHRGAQIAVPAEEAALADGPAALARLLQRHPDPGGDATLRRGLLAGWSLRAGDRILGLDGTLRRAPVPAAPEGTALRAAVADASTLAAATIDPALGPAAADGVRRAIARCARPDGELERGLFASTWAEGLIGAEARTALADALRAAAAPRLQERWEGDGASLERHDDAWGRSVWIWRSPGRLAYAMPAPPRAHRPQAPLRLAVELPPDADPWRDAARARRAELRLGARTVAAWDGAAVAADAQAWRLANGPPGADEPDGWPAPAIALASADGRLDSLLIGAHRIAAPADGGADAQAFLDRAAALRDPVELAAIGDHIFRYAYDSPDPTVPRLLGEEGRYADIHQTAAATLATAMDGCFRGDCDDLAEVYTEILARQGRLAHVLDLGDHAAAGFLERDGDGWAMRVLHSGPLRSWHGGSGAEAVMAAYAGLMRAGAAPRTAAAVGVLLRFAGEATRSPWRLSWRIFAEPDYAATMIAVQRDWHYRAYGHAQEAMIDLMRSGDEDPANLLELVGLCRRQREWLPARLHLETLMRQPGQDTLANRTDWLRYCCRDGDEPPPPGALVQAARFLPERMRADPAGAVSAAVRIALALPAGPDRDGLIEAWIAPWAQERESAVREFIERRFDALAWSDDRAFAAWRAGASLLAGQRLQRWRAGGSRIGTADWRWLDWWYGRACALPQRGLGNPLWLVLPAGYWMQVRLGDAGADRMVSAARPPAAWNGGAPRHDGLLAIARTASWLRISPPWWEQRIAAHAARAAGPERDADLRAAVARLDEAMAALPGLGLAEAVGEAAAIRARLLAALALDDAGLYESALNAIAARRDRELDEASAGILGVWGGALSPGRFALALQRWHAVVGVRAYALEVAWAAWHAGHRAAAVAAADAAEALMPGDPAVAAEAGRMRARCAPR